MKEDEIDRHHTFDTLIVVPERAGLANDPWVVTADAAISVLPAPWAGLDTSL